MTPDCLRNRDNIISTAILLTAVIVFFIMTDALGPYLDDFLYRIYFPPTNRLDWLGSARHNQSITDAVESYLNHCNLWNNARLANLIAFLFAMMPEWVSDITSSLCLGIALACMLRLSAGKEWTSSPLTVAGMVLTFFTLMPLHNPMMCTVFLQNYVWTTAFILPFIALILRRTHLRPKHMAALIIWGVIAGAMHEGFTVEWGCGLATWIALDLLQRKKTDPRRMLLVGVYLVSSLYLLLSPSTNTRIDGFFGVPEHVFASIVYGLLYNFRYLPFLIVALTVAIVKSGLSRLLSDRIIVTFTVAALIGPFVSVLTQSPPGSAWPGAIGALIVIWRLAHPYIASLRNQTVYAIFITAACSAWLLSIASIQRRCTSAAERFAEKLTETSDNIIYLDMPNDHDLPWWTDRKVLPLVDHNISYTIFHNYYRGGSSKRTDDDIYIPVAVFPERFKGLPLDSLPAVKGTAQLRGVYPFYIGPIVCNDIYQYVDVTFSTESPIAKNSTSPFTRLYNSLRYHNHPSTKHVITNVRKMAIADGDTIGLYTPLLPIFLSNYPILAIDHNFGADR